MNFTNVIAAFKIILTAVKFVEAFLPAGSGKEKLESAISILESVYGDLTDHVSQIEAVISGIVSLYNAIGVFKKKGAQPVSPEPVAAVDVQSAVGLLNSQDLRGA